MSGDANLVKKPLCLNILQVDSKLDTCSSHSNVCAMCYRWRNSGSKVYNWLIETHVKSRDLGIQEAVSTCGVSRRFCVY